jgi:hypothetical protein
MIDTRGLIDSLVAETRPVHRLRHPLVRALLWFGVALGIVGLLGIEHGLRPDFAVQMQKPSFQLGIYASLLTGILAACGCLIASLPDRSRAWLLLPAPSLVVWVSTVSYGCLTDWAEFDAGTIQIGEALSCFATLLLVSLPLSGLMFAMLRHVVRLRPTLVTLTAGLAVASITSSAMALFHALDATIMILVWNLGMAAAIVALEGLFGRSMLAWFARPAMV